MKKIPVKNTFKKKKNYSINIREKRMREDVAWQKEDNFFDNKGQIITKQRKTCVDLLNWQIYEAKVARNIMTET